MIRSFRVSALARRFLERFGARLPPVLAPPTPAPQEPNLASARLTPDDGIAERYRELKRDLQAAGFENVHLDAISDLLDAGSPDGRTVLLFRLNERKILASRLPDLAKAH